MFKFACIPSKYAPKRKMIDFALPKWRTKLGEFTDPDLLSWVNNLYQDKVYKTREEFNKAYDLKDDIHWRNKPMILTMDDVQMLNEQFEAGAFEDGQQKQVGKLLGRMLTVLGAQKVLIVY